MVKTFKCAKHISTFDFSSTLRNKDLFPKRIRWVGRCKRYVAISKVVWGSVFVFIYLKKKPTNLAAFIPKYVCLFFLKHVKKSICSLCVKFWNISCSLWFENVFLCIKYRNSNRIKCEETSSHLPIILYWCWWLQF